ncbi:hypothetical protein UCRNP2_4528 [Neofusicoccum parvum UCRNP2]|uniref:Uncharacterized protein n=1 Tax=Botryosphaeria parva (strain UCR-NP2) TaxID=1287680 RepID=R1GAV7_BOTPV|nr:hypothetical protein UCRNP2_4528 [Neofusicoccum parvum UCRNP2]
MWDTLNHLRAHGLVAACPIYVVTGLFHAMAVLLAQHRDSLAPGAAPQPYDSLVCLRPLLDDLAVLERTWPVAGWVRNVFQEALARLGQRAVGAERVQVDGVAEGWLGRGAGEVEGEVQVFEEAWGVDAAAFTWFQSPRFELFDPLFDWDFEQ